MEASLDAPRESVRRGFFSACPAIWAAKGKKYIATSKTPEIRAFAGGRM